ncbi:MAG: PfkB family carbohydrate kinase [Flavisolibacter sp.]
MNKVFCFGELLLRMSPESGSWLHHAYMPVYIGGAELNTASALSKWDISVAYCTALPYHSLSMEIVNYLKERNIDMDPVYFSGNRIGIYYLHQGADLKSQGVIYDRDHSSFSQLKPGMLDWDRLLNNISWFHFSAISPALNQNIALVCREALQMAEKKGITISVDLNYRSKLWQYGKNPGEIMPELVQHCDLIMGNLWSEELMLNIPLSVKKEGSKNDYLEQSERLSGEIIKQFPKCKKVANTFRLDIAEAVSYYATYYDNGNIFYSHQYEAEQIVDKVGSGDTFMAGLIYGNLKSYSSQETLDFATAAAFNKLFIKGDCTNASVEEIKNGKLSHE